MNKGVEMLFFKRAKKEEEKKEEVVNAIEDHKTSLDLPSFSSERSRAIQNMILEKSYQSKPPTASGVAMDSSCQPNYRGNFSTVNVQALGFLVSSSSFIGYQNMELLGQNWIIERACGLRVRDAIKKWYEITVGDGTALDASQIKEIEKMDKKYKLKENMMEAVFFKNVFGVRHILFKHSNPDFDYSQPFNIDAWGEGEYEGISQIDPSWIMPAFNDLDLSDPTRIDFYEPTYWVMNGKKYHKSHFVILRGPKVGDSLKSTYRYGGISLAQLAYERAYAAERSANEAPQLLMTKRLVNRFVDLAKAFSDKSKFAQKILDMVSYRDNFGVNILGKDENITQLDTTLSDVESVIKNQYEIVCAVFGDPVSKIMGTGHGGLGTGDTDEDYYISNVEQLQGDDLQRIGEAHYERLVATFVQPKMGVEPEIEMTWRPLKVMSAKELAEINNLNANTDSILESLGAIDSIDIANRLIADKNSGYSGIEEPDIEEEEHGDFGDKEELENGSQEN